MKPETQTSLKQAIRKLTYSSQVKPEVVETIVEELKKGEITQQEWETLFNQEGADIAIENKVHTPNFIRLLTLRSLIIPETLTEYQQWLDIRKNKKPEENQTITLNFQQALSSLFPQQQAALGITHLLTKLQNKKISVDEIYWLLSNNENKNIWAKSKKEFINIIKHDLELIENHNNKLIKTEFNEDSLIIKTGIWKTLIQKWEEIKKGNYQSQEYKKLAKLMEKLEESDLSAYFYQVSDGTVEKNLFYEVNPAFNVSLEIFGIPIKKRENWIDVSTRIIEEKLGIVSKETKKIEHYRKLYRELDRLLQAQNFKEADLETERIMLAVTKRKKEGWLRIEDAEKFPYKELRSIDKLWLKYSGGKFGISVQQQIYQSLGGTKKYNRDVWESIGDRLGWRRGGNWLNYSDYNFSQTAPSGHLPKAGIVHLQIERYAKLERLNNLLQAQNFKEADRETREIILVVANREKEGWLRVKDAEKFPCKELRSIDKLWLEHSGGKFGISVQHQIYQSLGGTKEYNEKVWESMGDRVGWRNESSWLSYSDLNFSQTEPSGRLPCVLSVGRGWRRWQFRWQFYLVLFGGFSVIAFAQFGFGGVVVLLVGLVVLVILGRGDAWLLGWLLGLGFVYVFLGALGLGLVFGLFLGLGVGIILLEGLPSSCSTVAQTLLFRDAECNNKMPLQQIQQPIIKPAKRSFLKTAGIAIGGLILVLMTQQIFGNQQPLLESNDSQPTETSYNPNPSESNPINVNTRYAKLESLLKAQDFRAADEETDRVMLAVAKREEEGYLRREDAEKFPCKELRSIDQLWLKYSRGKFGISVQQQILKSLGGTKEFDEDVWRSFGYRVGWRNERGYTLPYNWLNFSQTAPSGHLPVVYCLWDGGYFPPVQTCKV